MNGTRAGDEDFDRLYRQGMATLARAEARLGAARPAAARADADALAHLLMDATSALLLLRALAEGDMDRARVRREAARLTLAVAPEVLARLPQPARIGALELHALAGRLAAWIRRGSGVPAPACAPPQSEKPRRRPGRPRLHLVPESV